MRMIRILTPVLGAAALGIAALGVAIAPTAHAAVPTTKYVMPVHGGLGLDVWKRNFNVNAQIRLWTANSADPAQQFVQVFTTYSGHPVASAGVSAEFQIEAAPFGVPDGLCVSTISDTRGAFAALRHCANLAGVIGAVKNTFQQFTEVASGDQFNQLVAGQQATPYALNDKGFGGAGTNVISWTVAPTAAAPNNQLWDHVGA